MTNCKIVGLYWLCIMQLKYLKYCTGKEVCWRKNDERTWLSSRQRVQDKNQNWGNTHHLFEAGRNIVADRFFIFIQRLINRGDKQRLWSKPNLEQLNKTPAIRGWAHDRREYWVEQSWCEVNCMMYYSRLSKLHCSQTGKSSKAFGQKKKWKSLTCMAVWLTAILIVHFL